MLPGPGSLAAIMKAEERDWVLEAVPFQPQFSSGNQTITQGQELGLAVKLPAKTPDSHQCLGLRPGSAPASSFMLLQILEGNSGPGYLHKRPWSSWLLVPIVSIQEVKQQMGAPSQINKIIKKKKKYIYIKNPPGYPLPLQSPRFPFIASSCSLSGR